MSRCVIPTGFGIDEEANRQRGELLYGSQHRQGICRLKAAIDQNHSN